MKKQNTNMSNPNQYSGQPDNIAKCNWCGTRWHHSDKTKTLPSRKELWQISTFFIFSCFMTENNLNNPSPLFDKYFVLFRLLYSPLKSTKYLNCLYHLSVDANQPTRKYTLKSSSCRYSILPMRNLLILITEYIPSCQF